MQGLAYLERPLAQERGEKLQSRCVYELYFIIHLSFDAYLDWFHFLDIANKAATSMDEQMSL